MLGLNEVAIMPACRRAIREAMGVQIADVASDIKSGILGGHALHFKAALVTPQEDRARPSLITILIEGKTWDGYVAYSEAAYDAEMERQFDLTLRFRVSTRIIGSLPLYSSVSDEDTFAEPGTAIMFLGGHGTDECVITSCFGLAPEASEAWAERINGVLKTTLLPLRATYGGRQLINA